MAKQADIIDWYEFGKKAYEDGQPLHAAPSNPDAKEQWLRGWNQEHDAAKLEEIHIVHGSPVCLKKIGGQIYVCSTVTGAPVGDQKYLELENDPTTLDWTARLTFTGLHFVD